MGFSTWRNVVQMVQLIGLCQVTFLTIETTAARLPDDFDDTAAETHLRERFELPPGIVVPVPFVYPEYVDPRSPAERAALESSGTPASGLAQSGRPSIGPKVRVEGPTEQPIRFVVGSRPPALRPTVEEPRHVESRPEADPTMRPLPPGIVAPPLNFAYPEYSNGFEDPKSDHSAEERLRNQVIRNHSEDVVGTAILESVARAIASSESGKGGDEETSKLATKSAPPEATRTGAIKLPPGVTPPPVNFRYPEYIVADNSDESEGGEVLRITDDAFDSKRLEESEIASTKAKVPTVVATAARNVPPVSHSFVISERWIQPNSTFAAKDTAEIPRPSTTTPPISTNFENTAFQGTRSPIARPAILSDVRTVETDAIRPNVEVPSTTPLSATRSRGFDRNFPRHRTATAQPPVPDDILKVKDVASPLDVQVPSTTPLPTKRGRGFNRHFPRRQHRNGTANARNTIPTSLGRDGVDDDNDDKLLESDPNLLDSRKFPEKFSSPPPLPSLPPPPSLQPLPETTPPPPVTAPAPPPTTPAPSPTTPAPPSTTPAPPPTTPAPPPTTPAPPPMPKLEADVEERRVSTVRPEAISTKEIKDVSENRGKSTPRPTAIRRYPPRLPKKEGPFRRFRDDPAESAVASRPEPTNAAAVVDGGGGGDLTRDTPRKTSDEIVPTTIRPTTDRSTPSVGSTFGRGSRRKTVVPKKKEEDPGRSNAGLTDGNASNPRNREDSERPEVIEHLFGFDPDFGARLSDRRPQANDRESRFLGGSSPRRQRIFTTTTTTPGTVATSEELVVIASATPPEIVKSGEDSRDGDQARSPVDSPARGRSERRFAGEDSTTTRNGTDGRFFVRGRNVNARRNPSTAARPTTEIPSVAVDQATRATVRRRHKIIPGREALRERETSDLNVDGGRTNRRRGHSERRNPSTTLRAPVVAEVEGGGGGGPSTQPNDRENEINFSHGESKPAVSNLPRESVFVASDSFDSLNSERVRSVTISPDEIAQPGRLSIIGPIPTGFKDIAISPDDEQILELPIAGETAKPWR